MSTSQHMPKMIQLTPELLRKRAKLFKGKLWVPSIMSDLCMASGLVSYQNALPNMNQKDAEKLTELVEQWEKAVNEGPRSASMQRPLVIEMDKCLKGIIRRR